MQLTQRLRAAFAQWLKRLETKSFEVVHERRGISSWWWKKDNQELTWFSRNHGLREAMYFIFQQALLCYAVLAVYGRNGI